MDTGTLAVMISLATLGFAAMGLIWRSLDKRIDTLQRQIEAIRVQNDQQHLMIIDLLRDHGERIARIEDREEALAG